MQAGGGIPVSWIRRAKAAREAVAAVLKGDALGAYGTFQTSLFLASRNRCSDMLLSSPGAHKGPPGIFIDTNLMLCRGIYPVGLEIPAGRERGRGSGVSCVLHFVVILHKELEMTRSPRAPHLLTWRIGSAGYLLHSWEACTGHCTHTLGS